jgi:hypothetical protein
MFKRALRKRCRAFGKKHPKFCIILEGIDATLDIAELKLAPFTIILNTILAGVVLGLIGIVLLSIISVMPSVKASAHDTVPVEAGQAVITETRTVIEPYPVYVPVGQKEVVVEVAAEPIPAETWVVRDCKVPKIDSTFKAFMDADKITNPDAQMFGFKELYTDMQYGIHMINDRYVVALGTYYTGDEVGRMFDITLDTGVVIKVITGSIKADEHTDSKNQYYPNADGTGCVLEFVVEEDELDPLVIRDGDMSSDPSGLFVGNITSIQEVTLI